MAEAVVATQLCTFFVADEVFALEVERIQEVLRFQPITEVPLAPTAVRGLINLRGEIVTAVDLRVLLGLPDRPEDAEPMNVVVRTDGETVALLVDAIGDVVEVDGGAFAPPPTTLRGSARALIRGIYKQERQLLLLLDTQRATAFGDAP